MLPDSLGSVCHVVRRTPAVVKRHACWVDSILLSFGRVTRAEVVVGEYLAHTEPSGPGTWVYLVNEHDCSSSATASVTIDGELTLDRRRIDLEPGSHEVLIDDRGIECSFEFDVPSDRNVVLEYRMHWLSSRLHSTELRANYGPGECPSLVPLVPLDPELFADGDTAGVSR